MWVLGPELGVLYKSNKYSQPPSHLPAPQSCFVFYLFELIHCIEHRGLISVLWYWSLSSLRTVPPGDSQITNKQTTQNMFVTELFSKYVKFHVKNFLKNPLFWVSSQTPVPKIDEKYQCHEGETTLSSATKLKIYIYDILYGDSVWQDTMSSRE